MSASATIILQIILILVNAFFAGTEMALVSLNQTRLKKEAEEGDKKAAKLLALVDNPSRFLSAIQIAITLAGFLGAAFSADILSEELVTIFKSWGWDWGYTTMNTICVVLITVKEDSAAKVIRVVKDVCRNPHIHLKALQASDLALSSLHQHCIEDTQA